MSTNGDSNGRGRGGARPGAGRKPKALTYALQSAEAEQRIADALPALVDSLIGYAKGGDTGAAKYLIDRILGRVATIEAPPAEDTRVPYTEEDAEAAQAQHESRRSLERLIAGG